MEQEKQGSLAELKKNYKVLQSRYKLPQFQLLNQEFEVEKIQERETDFLLRELRHVISERIAAFLHFFELFLNPTTAPIFVLAALKTLNINDKRLIEQLYKELSSLEITSLALDMANYDENKEAVFIKNTIKKWLEIKPELQAFSALLLRIQPKNKEKRRAYVG